MGIRAVANILHSIAKLEESGRLVADNELAGKRLGRALSTAGRFDPQNVANLAVAKMDIKTDPHLLEAMRRRAMEMANDFNTQDVTHILWALATMGIEPDPRRDAGRPRGS